MPIMIKTLFLITLLLACSKEEPAVCSTPCICQCKAEYYRDLPAIWKYLQCHQDCRKMPAVEYLREIQKDSPR